MIVNVHFEVSNNPKFKRKFAHLDPNATRYHFQIHYNGYVYWYSNRGHNVLSNTVLNKLNHIYWLKKFTFINI